MLLLLLLLLMQDKLIIVPILKIIVIKIIVIKDRQIDLLLAQFFLESGTEIHFLKFSLFIILLLKGLYFLINTGGLDDNIMMADLHI